MCLGPMFSVPFFKINSNEPSNLRTVPFDKIISYVEDKIRDEPYIVAAKIREGVWGAINRYRQQVNGTEVLKILTWCLITGLSNVISCVRSKSI